MAAIFQPTVLDWLFGAGIGSNIGASIFWGLIAGGFGYWLKGHIGRIHARLDALHALHRTRHDQHAEHMERLGQSLIEAHEKLDQLIDAKPSPPA